MRKKKIGLSASLAILALVVAAMITGCSTLGSAISLMSTGLTTDSSGTASNSTGDSQSNRSTVPGFSPMQMQFYSIYAVTAPFGGYKAGGMDYKVGQGTVWELSGKNRGDTTTIEHALLKINDDGSRWWRVRLTSGTDDLLYEFLVATDSTVIKVRYKDPDTGELMEFVPDQARSSAQSGQAQTGMPPSDSAAVRGKMTTDKQTVTVKAGRFATDHTTYVDDQQGYKSETWTSQTVPGGMVRYVSTNLKSGEVSEGELVNIESNMTTVLQSF